MRRGKQVLFLLLTLVFVVTVFKVQVLETEAKSETLVNTASTTIASGKCGENVYWSLSDDGILTITGSGMMTEAANWSMVPWYDRMSSITTVIIEQGVTTISGYAFYGYVNLTNVTISDSVTRIGCSAFQNCDNLTSVTIPDSVTTIADMAFFDCGRLVSVRIGKKVKSIGDEVFSGCESLTAFYVDENNQNYSNDGRGVLFNNQKTRLILAPGAIRGFYEIPDSVTAIADKAFIKCSNLTSVEIPDSVTTIGNSAFSRCSNLTSVEIPNSVTQIGTWAFSECSKLESIRFNGNAPKFYTQVFDNVYGTVYYPGDNTTWTTELMERCNNYSINWVPEGKVLGMEIISTPECGFVNQIPNLRGLSVELIYGNNIHRSIDNRNLIISEINTTTAGKKKVTVSYNDVSSEFVYGVHDIKTDIVLDSAYYPESVHLPRFTEDTQTLTWPDAEGLILVFSQKTSVPDGVEYIYVYDATEKEIAKYTGNEASGVTLVVPGDTITVKIKTNAPSDAYGYSFDSIATMNIVHTSNEMITAVEPTCTQPGYTEEFICEICNQEKSTVIPAKGHNYETEVKNPSCTEKGYSIHRCKNCGRSYTDNEKAALGHKHGNWTTVKAATCENTGSEKRVCERCSNEETRTIAAKGHAYETVVTQPSCTGKGYSTHTCKTCGYSYMDNEKTALGHKYGNWITVNAATCENTGSEKRVCERCSNEETRTIAAKGHAYETVVTQPSCTGKGYSTHTCKTCGNIHTDNEKAALGHKYGNWTTEKEATCENVGIEKCVCERCNSTEIRTVDAKGHTYQTVTTAPSCTEKGYTTYTCKICGNSYIDNEKAALGHKYGNWTTEKAATCENAGIEKRVCERCNSSETRTVAAKGHTYQTLEKKPSCTEKGYTTYTCKTCGKSYTDNEKVALGHKYGNWTTVKAATCESAGSEKRVCERCGDEETRTLTAKGHAYETVVKDPDCTEKGYSTHTCKTCGKSYTDNEKAALGHKYGNWTTVKAATCESAGSEKCVCERCGDEETRTLEAKGHTYETAVKDPSCTEKGYSTHTCKNCGKNYTDNEKAALGHAYGSWTMVKEATCESAGSEKRVCGRCDDEETKTIEAKGHAYETEVKAPDCTKEGGDIHTCKNCGDSYSDNVTEALGHKLSDWMTGKKATCQEGGTEKKICERCDYEETRETPVGDHSYMTVTMTPTCEKSGYSIFICKVCEHSYEGDSKEPLGHSFTNYISDNNATEDFPGTKTAKCDRCDKTDTIPENSEENPGNSENPENPKEDKVVRLAGSTRYDTGYAVADVLKETLGVDKFEAVVVATGKNFADALAGSYLAVQKNAPIILTNGNADNVARLHEYIKANVRENGTVYILGGEAAVPESVEDISGYTVKRLAGSSRYDTNLEILLEAGISGDEIIVATGKSFADSLSASAAKLPILLVKPNATLDIAQKALLKNMNKFYIVGGEGAVSSAYETELAAYGMVERVFGSSRYDTSVEIAKAFCGSVDKIVVASGKNFPDGLCGGPLAAALNVPLILTRDNGADAAMEYAEENAVVGGYVLGGTGALTDDTVVDVFKLESAQEIK